MNCQRRKFTISDLNVEMAEIWAGAIARIQKHGDGCFVSPHEIMGVILEEVREMEDAARGNRLEEFYLELLDVAVACLVGMVSITNHHPDLPKKRNFP